jgi:ABC-type polysaccharide/polyol phosphate transport system ATPase subunit
MEVAPAISLSGVSKRYNLYDSPNHRLKELFTFNAIQAHRELWVLRDISVEIAKGETFCIIGENGSGKSTLLKLIAGILQPTSGTVRVRGRMTTLLELGSGFNPEFTGRENLYLNAAIHGLTRAEVDAKLASILAFAEIGGHIDQPLRTYSSGMAVRLGFALAAHLDPEILIVDEALAVGDIHFRQRCMRKIHELRASGVTLIFVSHDVADVTALGTRVLWLDQGRIRLLGEPAAVTADYLAALLEKDSQLRHHEATFTVPVASSTSISVAPLATSLQRHGDGRASVLGISLHAADGLPVRELTVPSRLTVRVQVRGLQPIRQPIIGVLLRTADGIDLAGANTAGANLPVSPLAPGEIRTLDFHFDLPELAPGDYTLTPAIADGDLGEYAICDMAHNAAGLRITTGARPVAGYLRFPCSVSVSRQ